MTCNAIRPTHDLGLVPDFSGASGARQPHRLRSTSGSTSSAPPRCSWPTTRRSSSAPASTASTRSPTSTCASRGGSASRSTRAAGSTRMPDWEATGLEPLPGRHDALEEPAMPDVDDGVLAGGRAVRRLRRPRGLRVDTVVRRELTRPDAHRTSRSGRSHPRRGRRRRRPERERSAPEVAVLDLLTADDREAVASGGRSARSLSSGCWLPSTHPRSVTSRSSSSTSRGS